MTKKWKEIMATACEAAACTPLQARRAWRAAASAIAREAKEGRQLKIIGLGSLYWKGSMREMPAIVSGDFLLYPVEDYRLADGAFPDWLYDKTVEQFWIFTAEDNPDVRAIEGGRVPFVLLQTNSPDVPGPPPVWYPAPGTYGSTMAPLGKAILACSIVDAGWRHGMTPEEVRENPPGYRNYRPMHTRLRMHSHKGVIERHRTGEM